MVMRQRLDRAYWQQMAEAKLPPEHEVVARNEAITGTYARWYTAQPLFKWAGMAAFSSHRVGLALMPYRTHLADDLLGDADATGDAHPPEVHTVLADLHCLRETNNLVFHDIGWAHLAYMSPEGGIEAVESCLADDPQSRLMLQGFRTIERGRLLMQGDAKQRREGAELAWEGNELLLKHEQAVIVQSKFDTLDADCRMFLSFFTMMDFNAVYVTDNFRYSSIFYPFMWLRGLPLLLQTASLPRITDLRQRWFWIEKSLIPLWRLVERSDPHLALKLKILMKGAPEWPSA
jgi:hypothetical protein